MRKFWKIIIVDGEEVHLDTGRDECIYDGLLAERLRTGTDRGVKGGIDLHTTFRRSMRIFYLLHWKSREGNRLLGDIEVISKDEAKKVVKENFDVLSRREVTINRLKRLSLYPEDIE